METQSNKIDGGSFLQTEKSWITLDFILESSVAVGGAVGLYQNGGSI